VKDNFVKILFAFYIHIQLLIFNSGLREKKQFQVCAKLLTLKPVKQKIIGI